LVRACATGTCLGKKDGQEILRKDGDPEAAFAKASKVLEGAYEYPFISHANLEPQNCTAWMKPDGSLELWTPTQLPDTACQLIQQTFGIAKEKIQLHLLRAGGSFGRRLSSDYILDAVAIAQKFSVPVKLMWTREDDLQHDHYRSAGFHFLCAALDSKGAITAWKNHFVSFGNPVVEEGKSVLKAGWGGDLPSRRISCTLDTELSSRGQQVTDGLAYGGMACSW